MKVHGVFIDLKNNKQVHWWNIVNLFTKAVDRIDVVDTVTGKTVGCMFKITGLFAKRIASKNLSFIDNPVQIEI